MHELNPHQDYLAAYWQRGYDGQTLGGASDAQLNAWHAGREARTTELHDLSEARRGLASTGGGYAQLMREVATFLRSSGLAMEADAAVDCDRAARWIDSATKALKENANG